MAVKGVSLLIDAAYKGSGAFRQATGELDKFAAEVKRQEKNINAEIANIIRAEERGLAKSIAQGRMQTWNVTDKSNFLTDYEASQQKGNVGAVIDSVKTLKTELFTAAAAIGAAAMAAKQAYEFAQLGAQVDQTTRSFNFLVSQVGMGPEVLDRLRSAANYTVDDLELMKDVNLLVAGSSGTMQKELIKSAPALMDIAKAAAKMMPSLYDTGTAYERIAMGIRRNSPKILDDLGIQIKLGEANENYAKQLGKTSSELTGEEQQMALLNAVLQQHDTYLKQTGGDAKATTDSYNKLGSGWKNFTDSTAKWFSQGVVGKFVNFWAAALPDEKIGKLVEYRDELNKTGVTGQQYADSLQAAAKAAGYLIDAQGNLIDQGRTGNVILRQNFMGGANFLGQLLDPTKYINAAQQVGAAQQPPPPVNAAERNALLGRSLNAAEGGIYGIYRMQAQERYLKEQKATQNAQEQLTYSVNGKLGPAYKNYARTTKELTEEQKKLEARLKSLAAMGFGKTSKTVQDTQKELDGVNQSLQDEHDNVKKATGGLLLQQAALGDNAQAQLELAHGLGLVDDTSYVTTQAMQQLKEKFDTNKDGIVGANENLGEYVNQVKLLADLIDRLQSKNITISLEVLESGVVPQSSQPKQSTSGQKPIASASGFHGVVPSGYPNDSYRAEFNLTSGEEVNVTPANQRGAGRSSVQQTIHIHKMVVNGRNERSTQKALLGLIGRGR